MDINELKNESIYLIRESFIGTLIFCVTLLWINTFPQNGFAQNNTESDLKELRAMSYLQGYNPPSKFKNVTLFNKDKSFQGYNLFVSSNPPGATLMDMNGKTIHRWYYPSASLHVVLLDDIDNWVRASILKDGDLLAMVPFGGLLKIDKKSRLIWFRRILCHHDFDIDSNGNIYTLTLKDSRLGDNTDIKIDSITILTPQGRIKKEISLYDLFKKYPQPRYINKINELARTKGPFNTNNGSKIFLPVLGDAFHSNSIQVLDGNWASKIPAFKKGNILISIRNIGVIICVDPDERRIVWLMDTVFWNQGQHFSKLLENGNILLFDNLYRPNLSRVVEFDPATKKIIWDYSNQNGQFFSVELGQCYRLPNGNTLITDSTNGHSFEVTPQRKIVWEFYNPNLDYVHQREGPVNINQTQCFLGKDQELVAVTDQMERIPIDSNLDWLKR